MTSRGRSRAASAFAFAFALAFAFAALTPTLSAQTRDSVRAPTPVETAPRRARPIASRLAPPITPKRAFLYSLALPGLGQSRLDRGTSGALFSSIELAALVMVRRSNADVREVKRYLVDSLPATFTVVNGVFQPGTRSPGRFTPELQRTRKLHVEDWLAVLAFNHLFAAADAFVAAQLWDVPVSLSASPRGNGLSVAATVHW